MHSFSYSSLSSDCNWDFFFKLLVCFWKFQGFELLECALAHFLLRILLQFCHPKTVSWNHSLNLGKDPLGGQPCLNDNKLFPNVPGDLNHQVICSQTALHWKHRIVDTYWGILIASKAIDELNTTKQIEINVLSNGTAGLKKAKKSYQKRGSNPGHLFRCLTRPCLS